MPIALNSLIPTEGGARLAAEEGTFDALVNGSIERLVSHGRHVGDALAIQTVPGYSIVCDPAQALRVAGQHSGWRWASDLSPGDQLVLSNNRPFNAPTDDNQFRAGWVIGLIAGNGGHNPLSPGGTYVRFWHDDDDPLIHEAEFFVRCLGVGPTFRGAVYNRINETYTIGSVELCQFTSQFLEARSKAIKPALETADHSFVAGFIRGFFDTDGSPQGSTRKGRSVRLSQSSRTQLIIVQRLLIRFGIASRLYARQGAGLRLMPDGRGGLRDYECSEMWELVISKDNIEQFAAKIGFSKPSKAARLSELVSSVSRPPYRELFLAEVGSIQPLGTTELIRIASDTGIFATGGFVLTSVPPRRRS